MIFKTSGGTFKVPPTHSGKCGLFKIMFDLKGMRTVILIVKGL